MLLSYSSKRAGSPSNKTESLVQPPSSFSAPAPSLGFAPPFFSRSPPSSCCASCPAGARCPPSSCQDAAKVVDRLLWDWSVLNNLDALHGEIAVEGSPLHVTRLASVLVLLHVRIRFEHPHLLFWATHNSSSKPLFNFHIGKTPSSLVEVNQAIKA